MSLFCKTSRSICRYNYNIFKYPIQSRAFIKNLYTPSLPQRHFHISRRTLQSQSAEQHQQQQTTEEATQNAKDQYTNAATQTTRDSSSIVPRGRLFFVTLVKSPHHQTKDIKSAISALKLKKINQVQVHKDTPQIRGLIYKCRYLLSVKSVSTREIFPEGTEKALKQFLPNYVRLSRHELKEIKIQSMRQGRSVHKLIQEYIQSVKNQNHQVSQNEQPQQQQRDS